MKTMKLLPMLTTPILLATLLAPVAFGATGGVHGGGGDAIICKKGVIDRLLFPNSVNSDGWNFKDIYLADTFEYLYRSKPSWVGKLPERESQIKRALIRTFEARKPGLGKAIESRLAKLEFYGVKKLEELDNDYIDVSELPDGCKKTQLAVQDFGLNRVRVLAKYYHALTQTERALLQVHEALIALRGTAEDTTPIRKQVKSALESSEFLAQLKKAVAEDQDREMTPAEKLERTKTLVFHAFPRYYDGFWNPTKGAKARADFERDYDDRDAYALFRAYYTNGGESERITVYYFWRVLNVYGMPITTRDIRGAMRCGQLGCKSIRDMVERMNASVNSPHLKDDRPLFLKELN